MKQVPILLILFCLISCGKENAINLTKMDGFPPEIIGCSCYYAETETDFKAQQYIYVDSYERNPAFISIDGQLETVDAENSTGAGYEVILDITKEVQLGAELYHKEGTLTVVHESGAVVTRAVYGECGC